MLKKFVRHQVNFISTNANITDIYELDRIRFGLESVYGETIKLITMLFIAIILNKLTEFLIMMSLLLLIRPHVGGSHAKSFLGCLVKTNILFLVLYYIAEIIPKINLSLQLIIAIISIISVNKFKPVNRHRKKLNVSYKNIKFKNIVIATILLWLIISNLFLSDYLLNCGTLIIIYIIVDYLKEVYIHEKNKQI